MTDFDDLKLGAAFVVEKENLASALPLRATKISGEIIGESAAITVEQQFINPFDIAIEIAYLFPLPHTAAIYDYSIQIGERTIQAALKAKDQAEADYRKAAEQGKRASLLNQQRPNLFSIAVANVQPGEVIITRISCDDRLKVENEALEFVIPMGITPRYYPLTAPAEDVENLSPAYTEEDAKVSGVEIALTTHMDGRIERINSPSHPLDMIIRDNGSVTVQLAGRHIPNKDFVLRLAVAGEKPQLAVYSSHSDDSETILATLAPPRYDAAVSAPPREFVFILDRSGSMHGKPLEQAVNALKACLRAMGERDTFYLQAFESAYTWFRSSPSSVTQEDVNAADTWLNGITSRGGTEILSALRAALNLDADPERQRTLIFLTDGAVSNEAAVLETVTARLVDGRIFTFGLGPSVNRYFIDKLAQLGRGTAQFVGLSEDIETAITRFQDRISQPALQDLSLDWEGARVEHVFPHPLPDLYTGQPLQFSAKFQRTGDTRLILTGKLRDEVTTQTANLPPASDVNPLVERLYARAHIEMLADRVRRERLDTSSDDVKQIIALSLRHRILTGYTAFVAIDSATTDSKGGERVEVALPLPEGLDWHGFLGAPAPAGAMMLAAPMNFAAPGGGILRAPVAKRSSSLSAPSLHPADDDLLLASAPPKLGLVHPDVLDNAALQAKDIKALARQQRINGSWGDDPIKTSRALAIFMDAGHTTQTGSYRRQLLKAVTWLLAQIPTLLLGVREQVIPVLDRLYEETGDGRVADEWR
jgi:Ca-activated chloride channel family protein